MDKNEVKKIKIGVKDVMAVTPDNPRTVPLIDPCQVDTVRTLCTRQSRRNPDLLYTFHVRLEADKGLFHIYARPKEEKR